jgi:hypothetical protein
MHLLKHLSTRFPGLSLEPPLSYSWPIALRFELNSSNGYPPDLDAITARASTIYESAFAATDVAYIISVCKHFPGYGHRRPFGYQGHEDKRLFTLTRRHHLGISRPSGVVKMQHTRKQVEDWGASRTRIEWAEISPGRIDFRSILRKIAQSDFPIGAGIDGDIFFYNQTCDLILHMYEDRGLDLIATTRAALQPIHDAHQAWLLPGTGRDADFRAHRLH